MSFFHFFIMGYVFVAFIFLVNIAISVYNISETTKSILAKLANPAEEDD